MQNMDKLFNLSGIIKKNIGRGKELGYPTANITVYDDAPEGVYTGFSSIKNRKYPSLVFIGRPLTFNENDKKAEVYILDFAENIYGEKIEVEVCKKLRGNFKFNSQEDLIDQMKEDERQARTWFANSIGYNKAMNFTFDKSTAEEAGKNIYKTSIDGLYYVDRKIHGDNRGFFSEVGHIPEISKLIGKEFIVKQVNHARSQANVARGIHAEDWNKFVFISSGKAFCAVADLRKDSKTFKKVETFILGYDGLSLPGGIFVSKGLGNSVVSLEEPLDYIYFVDKLYSERDTAGDIAISLFDPDLNIKWPIKREDMIISERDKNAVNI